MSNTGGCERTDAERLAMAREGLRRALGDIKRLGVTLAENVAKQPDVFDINGSLLFLQASTGLLSIGTGLVAVLAETKSADETVAEAEELAHRARVAAPAGVCGTTADAL